MTGRQSYRNHPVKRIDSTSRGATHVNLAYPRTADPQVLPGVIVIHENRGLVEHIKEVTRRVARAGFVGLGVDRLSRQGGTPQFVDPVEQMATYGRTTQPERRVDVVAGLTYLKGSGVRRNSVLRRLVAYLGMVQQIPEHTRGWLVSMRISGAVHWSTER